MGRSTVAFASLLALVALLACKKSAPSTESTPARESAPVAAPVENTPAPAAPAPAAAAKDFSGTWDTAWGKVILTQTGSSLTGSYAGQFTGKLSGEAAGNVATLTWTQTNGESGKAKFTLSADGDKFSGTWGSSGSATNGGAWNGKRKN